MTTVTPIALRIENFRSFKKEQTFPFPSEPGLYFVMGRNESEPRLSANGTGKSTVWDALTWLLHGKTPAGLKAGDVCNWDVSKGTRVELDFITDGDERCTWTVARTWGPISWTLSHVAEYVTDEATVDLAKDPENPVLAAVRLGFEPWLCSVLMAQGGDYFLDMKKDAQASLFSSVMDLDGWVRRSERASDAARDQDAKSRRLERELAEAEGRLEMLERQDCAGDAERWEEKRRERLARLEKDHRDLTSRRGALKTALDAAQGREEDARKGLAAAQADRALEDAEAEAAREVRRLQDRMVELGARGEGAKEELKRLSAAGDAACPTCGQAMSTAHWQKEAARLERRARDILAEAQQLTRELEPVQNRHRRIVAELHAQEESLAAARRALDDAARDAARGRGDLAMCDRQLDGVEDLYEEAGKEPNPFADAVERSRREAADLRDRVRELRRELNDSDRLHSIKTYWQRGFKEIRLREIASALSELEVEVNSCLTELGLEDWELEFSVDRETKAGGVQRGFAVSVRAPDSGGRAVPWEAWSGGEKQRMRLAGNAGLANLVRARTGCEFPLEVWDEPTSGLSPEGKADLFAALAARARREARVVFLVDHQAHDFGGFAGTATIIKTPSGSRVRASWAKDV